MHMAGFRGDWRNPLGRPAVVAWAALLAALRAGCRAVHGDVPFFPAGMAGVVACSVLAPYVAIARLGGTGLEGIGRSRCRGGVEVDADDFDDVTDEVVRFRA